jgi:hypothetical protein
VGTLVPSVSLDQLVFRVLEAHLAFLDSVEITESREIPDILEELDRLENAASKDTMDRWGALVHVETVENRGNRDRKVRKVHLVKWVQEEKLDNLAVLEIQDQRDNQVLQVQLVSAVQADTLVLQVQRVLLVNREFQDRQDNLETLGQQEIQAWLETREAWVTREKLAQLVRWDFQEHEVRKATWERAENLEYQVHREKTVRLEIWEK